MGRPGRFSKLEISEAEPKKGITSEVPEGERGGDYYGQLARRCHEEGDYENSLKYYSRVLEYERQEKGAWLGQVRCLIELDELKEANVWCDKALDRFTDDSELLAAKAIVHSRMGDFSRAQRYSDASLEKQTSSAYLWVARGEVFLASRGKQPEYCLEKAISESPKDWFLYCSIGKVCMYYRKYALASKYFLGALELHTSSPFLYLETAKCYQALGSGRRADFCCEQALVLKPNYRKAEELRRILASRGLFARLFRRG